MVRSKYRYAAVKITPLGKKGNSKSGEYCVKDNDIYRSILLKIKQMHGDFGLASVKTGFSCKYCNEMTGIAIIKARHGPHRFLISIIPYITQIKKDNVLVETIRLTATLKGAYKFLKVYQKRQLEKDWNELKCKKTAKKYLDLSVVESMLEKKPKNHPKVDVA